MGDHTNKNELLRIKGQGNRGMPEDPEPACCSWVSFEDCCPVERVSSDGDHLTLKFGDGKMAIIVCTGQDSMHGLYVRAVRNKAAYDAGLRKHMLIESINGADISDLEFKKASFSVKFAARPASIVFRANSGGVMNQTAYKYNPGEEYNL